MMIKRIAGRAYRSAKRRWALYELSHADNASLRAIGDAIRETLSGSLTDQEQVWVERIEALRERINESSQPIMQLDFGAGNADSDRNAETMSGGVEVSSTLGSLSRKVSKPARWCALLFHLVRQLQPQRCLEMGTAVGISGSYQAAALTLNGKGRLTTLEGAPMLAEISRGHFDELKLENTEIIQGRFADTLERALAQEPNVDLAFVDGHHDEQATWEYFETICQGLADDAVIIFDDIAWSPGMKRVWAKIRDDSRVSASVDLGPIGITLIGNSNTDRHCYQLRLADA